MRSASFGSVATRALDRMMWKWGLTSASAHTALREHQRARRQPWFMPRHQSVLSLAMAPWALWLLLLHTVLSVISLRQVIWSQVCLCRPVPTHPQGCVKGSRPAYNSTPCQTRVELCPVFWQISWKTEYTSEYLHTVWLPNGISPAS